MKFDEYSPIPECKQIEKMDRQIKLLITLASAIVLGWVIGLIVIVVFLT